MNVLWISPGFAANEEDTTCIPALQLLATELKSRGTDLYIITLAYPKFSNPYFWNSISVKSSYGMPGDFLKWLNWIRAFRYGLNLIKEKKIDIIHSFWLGPGWLIGKYLAKKCSVPHITTLMGQDVLKSNNYIHLIQSADVNKLVSVSQLQANEFYKTCGLYPSTIIEWGLRSSDKILKVDAKRTIDIIGCGSLIEIKNWMLWIDTVTQVISRNKTIQAIIIGDGPEKNKIQNRIREYRLQNNIRLVGSLPRADVLNYMAQSKVFLHASTFESYGMVIPEAFSMGCHVVSTPVGIAENYGKTGKTVEELHVAVMESLKNESKNNIEMTPDIKNTAKQYLGFYEMQVKSFKKKGSS